MSQRPTLEQVARLAGVSRATVSRVVNDVDGVSEAVRTSVREAIEALGYIPNPAARSLVTRRTGIVALVVSESTTRVFCEDPFLAGVIRGVSGEIESVDRQLVLMFADTPNSRRRAERYANGHVDGVILLSEHGNDPLQTALTSKGLPVISGGRPMSDPHLPYVDYDNTGGARRAVEHLIHSGRRRIATIAGPQDMTAGVDRLIGYRQSVLAAGRRAIVAYGDFGREGGEHAMRTLLDDEPDLDAVFVASDLMAFGAYRALRQAGRRVPEDVAVIGFDDVEEARYTEPPLSTVRQSGLRMGGELVHMMERVICGQPSGSPQVLATDLVLRDSA